MQRPPMHVQVGHMHASGYSGPSPMHRPKLGPVNGPQQSGSPHQGPPLPVHPHHYGGDRPVVVPPPPPLVRESDVGVPGEDGSGHQGKEGGEENMELEEEQENEDEGSGWGNTGWNNPSWGGGGPGWSEGSNSHSNSPEIFSSRGGGVGESPAMQTGSGKGSSNGREGGRWKEGRTEQVVPPMASLPSLMEVDTSNIATLNEAQRKKLPSWIRAGLEKMEKDKLKKEQEEERRKRIEDKKRLAKLENAKLAKDPASSKFDTAISDEEDDDENGGPRESPELVRRQRKSRFEEDKSAVADVCEKSNLKIEEDKLPQGEKVSLEPPKSKEDILAEMSTNLRMLLTSLLLEVTGEEMDHISAEVLDKARSKTNSRPQLQTLLSGYGSESSSSDSDSDGPESEQELKTSLSKKRKNFKNLQSKILDFCEEETAAYKARERRWLEGKADKKKKSDRSSSSSPSQTTVGKSSSSSSGSDSDTSGTSSSQRTAKKIKTKKKEPKRGKDRDSSAESIVSQSIKGRKEEKKSCVKGDHLGSSRRSSSRETKLSKTSEKRRSKSGDLKSIDRKRSKSRDRKRASSGDKRSKSREKKSKKSLDNRSRSRSRRKSNSGDRKKSRSRDRKKSRSRDKRSQSKSTPRRGRSRSTDRKRARSKDKKRLKSKNRQKITIQKHPKKR